MSDRGHSSLTLLLAAALLFAWPLTRRKWCCREIEEHFAPVAVKQPPLFTREVLGCERLEELARGAVL